MTLWQKVIWFFTFGGLLTFRIWVAQGGSQALTGYLAYITGGFAGLMLSLPCKASAPDIKTGGV